MRLSIGPGLRAPRLGLKHALLGLAGVWLAWLAVMTLGFRHSIRSLEEEFRSDTARLLAREQSSLVVERSVEALRYPDSDSRRRLQERIEDLTVLSEVVTSLAVVDREGHVVASQPRGPRQREAPVAALFGDPPRPLLESRGQSFLRGGDYVVRVPLLEGREVLGYLRVGVHSDRIATLYAQGWGRLAALGVLGLLAAGGLTLVQLRLSRRVARLAASLQGARPAREALVSADEFARELRQASRVNGDLEKARRQSENDGVQAGALAQLIQVGVVIAGRDLQVEHVSARARELCGCADEEEFAQAWALLAPALRRTLDQPPTEPDGGRSALVEVRPGQTVRAEVHRPEGSAEGHLVVLSDPRALEAVENDARLLRQIDGLGRIYRTLAHELRAPLGAAMLNLETLQEHIGDGTSTGTGAQRCVGVLRGELNRLSRSLQGILNQTVPEASPVRFDLAGSLSDLVAFLAPQALRQSVKVEVRVEDRPLPVHGYPDRLRQAFLNVAVNALEAMPRGGQLTVEARRDGTRARVAMRDTGPGIPATVLSRVYDSDFTTKNGGSGIGLHVARAVVELHGGEIGVESQPGRGTDVLVHVPLAPGSP